MSWLAVAISVGATGMGMQMKKQYEAGKAAQAQARDQAIMLDYNARLALREAEQEKAIGKREEEIGKRAAEEELEAAAVEERKLRKGGERLKARQRAAIGKAGVEPTGSVEELLEETAEELEVDALMIRRSGQARSQAARYGGRVARYRGEAGAQSLTAEAVLSRMRGKSALLRGRAARRASRWGMASTGLMGGTQLAFMAYQPKPRRSGTSPWSYSRNF